jgi:hypothetical protein
MLSCPVAFLIDELASIGFVEASFGLLSRHSFSISLILFATWSSSFRIFACKAGIYSCIVALLLPRICLNDAHSPSITSM